MLTRPNSPLSPGPNLRRMRTRPKPPTPGAVRPDPPARASQNEYERERTQGEERAGAEPLAREAPGEVRQRPHGTRRASAAPGTRPRQALP